VVGAGAAKRLSAVRWGVAGNIAAAWVITLPAAGLFGAAAYWLASAFGHGAAGPLVMSLLAVAIMSSILGARRRRLAAAAGA
jgi:PiT family inorganic phosphate transporter